MERERVVDEVTRRAEGLQKPLNDLPPVPGRGPGQKRDVGA